MSTPKRPVRRPVPKSSSGAAGRPTGKKPVKPRRKIAGETRAPVQDQSPTFGERFGALLKRDGRTGNSSGAGRAATSSSSDQTAETSSGMTADLRGTLASGGPVVWVVGLVMAVAIGFLIASVVRSGISVYKAREDTSVAAAQSEAVTAAVKAAGLLFAYDYETIDEDLEAAKTVLTPDYADDVRRIDESVKSLAQQTERSVSVEVRDAAAMPCGTSCSTSTVDVLAFIDLQRTADGEPVDPLGTRSVLTMQKIDGKWLVDGVDNG